MTATLTTIPKPSWALTVWYDDNGIVVEIPSAYGPYYIRYPYTEGGLSKALKLLRIHREDCCRKGPRPIKNSKGQTLNRTHPIKRPITAGTTQENRDKVREILKKRGLI